MGQDFGLVIEPMRQEKIKARIALQGVEGTGKTTTAQAIAGYILGGEENGVGVTLPRRENGMGQALFIDSEYKTGKKNTALFPDKNDASQSWMDYVMLNQESKTHIDPRIYIAAIDLAEQNEYPLIIIDSASHAWLGTIEEKEQLDEKGRGSRGNNEFTNWRIPSKIYREFFDRLLTYPGHVIITLRMKKAYVLEYDSGKGKTVPRALGQQAVLRDGFGFEFDLIMTMSDEGMAYVEKSRNPNIPSGTEIYRPGIEFADNMLSWMGEGVEPAMSRSDFMHKLDIKGLKTPADIKTVIDKLGLADTEGRYKYNTMYEAISDHLDNPPAPEEKPEPEAAETE